eukprot:5132087-Amphidinium_carterae.1
MSPCVGSKWGIPFPVSSGFGRARQNRVPDLHRQIRFQVTPKDGLPTHTHNVTSPIRISSAGFYPRTKTLGFNRVPFDSCGERSEVSSTMLEVNEHCPSVADFANPQDVRTRKVFK